MVNNVSARRLALRAIRAATQPSFRERPPTATGSAYQTGRFAAIAGATVLASTGSIFVHADSTAVATAPPTDIKFSPYSAPSSELQGWDRLSHGDLSTALTAAEELCSLTADADNHRMLIKSGAIDGLVKALERALSDTSEIGSIPLAARSLAALADLARTHPSDSRFIHSGVSSIFTRVLKQFPVVESKGWLQWLGLYSSSSSSSIAADLRPGIARDTLRCLANLSRDSSTHTELLKSGALDAASKVLLDVNISLLEKAVSENDAIRIESMRYATCSVSALAKTAPKQVVALKVHKRLVEYCKFTEDAVIQTYATGGLRNLSRHPPPGNAEDWRVHREVVVAGAPEALAVALSAKTNPQTQTFAVLALSDLISCGHHRVHLIRRYCKVAYEPLAQLAISSTSDGARGVATRTALRAIHNAYNDGFYCEELTDALVPNMGQWIQGPVARGDVAAVRALASAVKEAKVARVGVEEGGILEVLHKAIQRGRGPYFDEASRCLAELAVHIPNLGRMLDIALKRPCPTNDGIYTAKLAANAARNEEHRPKIAHAILPFLILLAGSSTAKPEAKEEAIRALYNLSLGGPSRVMVVQADAMLPLLKVAKTTGGTAAMGALVRISESLEYAGRLLAADIVGTLLEACECPDLDVASREKQCIPWGVRTLANIASNDTCHETFVADKRAIEWLGKILTTGKPPDAHYYATVAICNLAYSAHSKPAVREALREVRVLEPLNAIAASSFWSPEVLHAARQAIVNLKSFGVGDATNTPAMVAVETRTNDLVPL